MTNQQIQIAKDRIDRAKAEMSGNYGFCPADIHISIDKIQRMLHKTWLRLDVEEKNNNLHELMAIAGPFDDDECDDDEEEPIVINEKEVCDKYLDGRGTTDICKDYECSDATIGFILKKNKITLRPIGSHSIVAPINNEFFNTWSHDMAYILGFITADGCVQYGGETRGKSLCIALNSKDEVILEYIRDHLSPNRKIQRYKSLDKEYDRIRFKSILSIGSTTLVDSLIKLGVEKRKTGHEVLPKVPNKFKSSYLRGYFDGDGYIGYKEEPYRQYNGKKYNGLQKFRKFEIICANEQFLKDVKDKLGLGLGVVKASGKYFRWQVFKTESIIKLYNYMYSVPGFALQRKKDIFETIIKDWNLSHGS